MATTGYSAGVQSDAVEISYAPEATWGTLPAVAFQAIRATGESLSGQKQRQRPNEMNPSRQASAAITTQESAGGGINWALSYGTYDDLLAAVMGSTWSTALAIDSITTDISFVAASNKMTSTLAGKFSSISVGQWIKVSGATTSSGANNGFYRVSAKTSATDVTLAGKTLIDETSAAGNIKVRGSMIRNGTIFQSFHLQKKLASALFLRYPGAYPNSASLSAGMGQFLQGSFNFLAKSEADATTDASTGSVVAAPTGKVHDPVAGFGGIQLDDTNISAVAGSISLDMQNDGAAANYGLGSAAAQGVIPGTFTASGKLSTYFRDFDLYARFKAETGGPLAFRTLDADLNAYVVTVLNSTIMNPKIVAGGPNQAVLAEFDIEGNPSSYGPTLQVDRFPAAA